MAQGQIQNGISPTIPLTVFGQTIDAVIDTGFEGGLQLPDSLERFLPAGATPKRLITFELPLGGSQIVRTFETLIRLDGHSFLIEVFFAQTDMIILGIDGMARCHLTIDFPAATVDLECLGP